MDEVDGYSAGRLIELLRLGRMYGVNLALITQRIADTEASLRNELLRTGTLVSFRLSSDNAAKIAPEFHKNISIDSICMLKKYHVFIRTLTDGNPIVYEDINNELENFEKSLKSVEEISKLKIEKTIQYGKPVTQVEEEIAKRMG